MHLPATTLQLRSLIRPDGELELSLADVPLAAPADNEIVIRIEASPINPSDIGLLLAMADPSSVRTSGSAERPVVHARVPDKVLAGLSARVGQSLPVGNEGAGTVVAAGARSQALLGRTVAAVGGAMYSQYRTIEANTVLVLPEGTRAAEGASCFINPLTSLGMVETMRREGHKALVHTVGASNLGQMLNRICRKDGIALVNIVRRGEQERLLRAQGAQHVVDSSREDFPAELTQALAETGATLAFDAIGGGTMAAQVLGCMEAAVNRGATQYSRYGSSVHKQIYLYGGLDRGPTVIQRNFGMAWGVGGWLLFPFLQKIGNEAAQQMRERVLTELHTTFASHYTAEVSLAGALRPEAIARYGRQATGEKYLINPALP